MADLYSDLASFRQDPRSFFMERGDGATEKLVPLDFGPDPFYLLTDPDYVKPLLMMSDEVIDKGPLYKPVAEIFGDTVFNVPGQEHRRRRAIWNTLVTRNAAAPLVPSLAAETRAAIATVAKSQKFEGREFAAGLAMRFIGIVAFGSKVLTSEEEKLLKQTASDVLTGLIDKVLGPQNDAPSTDISADQRIEQARKNLLLIITSVLERTPNSPALRAFSELNLSELELTNELMALLFAGNDSTGSAIAWLLYVFATIPELADSIAAESALVRNETGDIDFTKLVLATRTISASRELLRMYPTNYWIPRGARQDVEFAGRKLTAGSTIIIPQWLFHRSSRFWDAPNEFRLDRDFDNTAAYIPFGTGPRICAGWTLALLEIQVVALEVASALQLSLVEPLGATTLMLLNLWPPPIHLIAHARNGVPSGDQSTHRRASAQSVSTEAGTTIDQCPFRSQI